MKYNAIIFDLGGVLLPIDFQRSYNHFQQLGIEQIEQHFSRASQTGLFQQFELGLLTAEEFLASIKTYAPSDITAEQITDAWNQMILEFPEEHYRLLSDFKKAYKVFLLSNTNIIHYRYYTEQFFCRFRHPFEEMFTKTYFSFRCHLRKPDRAFFQLVLAENGLSPDSVIFFDDDINNITAAAKLGIHAVHITDENPLIQAVRENIIQTIHI